MTRLSVEGLSASYGSARTLHDITFSVSAGEAVGLLGRNGMGKTSTLRALMRLASPAMTAGRVTLEDQVLSTKPPYQVARLGLGYVPQGRRVFGSLSVVENLRTASRKGARSTDSMWGVDRVLTVFPQLAARKGTRAGRLSGGEQQMLAIGRALVGNPAVLLLDEPSEGLAPAVVQEMVRVLAELRETGLTILLAEQNLALAAEITDRFVILENGTVATEMAKAEFLADHALQGKLLGLGSDASLD